MRWPYARLLPPRMRLPNNNQPRPRVSIDVDASAAVGGQQALEHFKIILVFFKFTITVDVFSQGGGSCKYDHKVNHPINAKEEYTSSYIFYC